MLTTWVKQHVVGQVPDVIGIKVDLDRAARLKHLQKQMLRLRRRSLGCADGSRVCARRPETPLSVSPDDDAPDATDATDAPDASEACFICLQESGDLVRPCRCPRHVHARCLARWQLQRAGGPEESACRFCGSRLPDWRPGVTPAEVDLPAVATMAVVLDGRERRFLVSHGPGGRERFESEIRKVFALADDDVLVYTFDCHVPPSSATLAAVGDSDKAPLGSRDDLENVQLEGRNAYEAAFHCACVTAAVRAART
jgi:RING-variant domain